MNLFRRTPEPESAPVAATEIPEPEVARFRPWPVAAAWAATAGITSSDGQPVRRTRYGTHQPLTTTELRTRLAEYSAQSGWPTDRPVGRLDALEEAAREVLSTFYKTPTTTPGTVNPLAPPPTWARRGDQNALPDPVNDPGWVAEVFVREQCYTSEGRAVAQINGQLHAWDHKSARWQVWGTHSDLAATIDTWMAGERYWLDDTSLHPCGGATTAIVGFVETLLQLPGEGWPSGPAAVAAHDHQAARRTAPTHTYLDVPGAYTPTGGIR